MFVFSCMSFNLKSASTHDFLVEIQTELGYLRYVSNEAEHPFVINFFKTYMKIWSLIT